MNKYFKLKRKRKRNDIGTFFLYFILFSVVGAILFISYFSKVLGPGLVKCAEDEVERLVGVVLNNGIRKYLSCHEVGDVLEIVRGDGEKIELIRYDTKRLNQVMVEITEVFSSDLDDMVRGNFSKLGIKEVGSASSIYQKMNDGILFSISMGSATGNPLLANIGPKIPLNLSVITDAFTDVDATIRNYGLNNAMVDVRVVVKVSFVIQMPFLSKKVTIKRKIPLTMEIINGEIPNYYFSSSSLDNSGNKSGDNNDLKLTS